MVNMIIDGKHVSAEENITIMEAAERNGIPIPKLCYLKGINEIAACRVCVVELEGKEKLITSCNNMVKDGMVVIAMIAGAIFGGSPWIATSAYFIGMAAIVVSGIMQIGRASCRERV